MIYFCSTCFYLCFVSAKRPIMIYFLMFYQHTKLKILVIISSLLSTKDSLVYVFLVSILRDVQLSENYEIISLYQVWSWISFNKENNSSSGGFVRFKIHSRYQVMTLSALIEKRKIQFCIGQNMKTINCFPQFQMQNALQFIFNNFIFALFSSNLMFPVLQWHRVSGNLHKFDCCCQHHVVVI